MPNLETQEVSIPFFMFSLLMHAIRAAIRGLDFSKQAKTTGHKLYKRSPQVGQGLLGVRVAKGNTGSPTLQLRQWIHSRRLLQCLTGLTRSETLANFASNSLPLNVAKQTEQKTLHIHGRFQCPECATDSGQSLRQIRARAGMDSV